MKGDTNQGLWQATHPKKVKKLPDQSKTNILSTAKERADRGEDVPIPNAPEVVRGDNGITVALPNGERWENVSVETARDLVAQWDSKNAPISEKEKMQAELDTAAKKKALEAEQPEAIAQRTAAEQAAQEQAAIYGVQEFQAEKMQEMTGKSIEENIRLEQVIEIPGIGISGPDLLNIVPGLGRRIADVIASGNPDAKAFLSDYSNKDNLDSVEQDVKNAITSINEAIALASVKGYKYNARQMFNDALTRIRIADAQLKKIADASQREAPDAKLKRRDIADFERNMLPGLRNDFEIAAKIAANTVGGVQ